MYRLKLASALVLSLIVLQPAQAWDEGELFNTTLLETGISIINGETVFLLRISPSFPIPWDPAEPCFYARLFGRAFFAANTENPSFADQGMYLMALNAMSRGGQVTIEMGGCELPPGGGPTLPEMISDPDFWDMPLRKVERIILVE